MSAVYQRKTSNRPLQALFPEKLAPLVFDKCRYKVIYGGRGGGRSWGCARALLIKAMQKPIRVLCAREVQKSIKDSVHKLLSDQIQMLGIGGQFEVLESMIRVKNGGEFTFSGLSSHTIESIKSMEGVDYVWCEEAQTITKRSWDILIPTIRKPDSEIWVTFNPSLETDETFKRFVSNPPPDCWLVKLNYSDNPFFPDVLEKERLYCQRNDPDNYDNIWEGDCLPAVEGAIYYKEIQRAIDNNRVCAVPYDPFLKVHVVLDLGWNDATAIILCQKHASEIRVIDYIEDNQQTLAHYSATLKEKMLNWGKLWLPHDGYAKDIKTGKSTAEIMTRLGWDVAPKNEVTQLGLEDGIRTARMIFGRVYFDKDKTKGLIEALKRYRRRINNQTEEPGSPLHDDASHGADCFRYMCINADQMTNDNDNKRIDYQPGYQPLDDVIGY